MIAFFFPCARIRKFHLDWGWSFSCYLEAFARVPQVLESSFSSSIVDNQMKSMIIKIVVFIVIQFVNFKTKQVMQVATANNPVAPNVGHSLVLMFFARLFTFWYDIPFQISKYDIQNVKFTPIHSTNVDQHKIFIHFLKISRFYWNYSSAYKINKAGSIVVFLICSSQLAQLFLLIDFVYCYVKHILRSGFQFQNEGISIHHQV